MKIINHGTWQIYYPVHQTRTDALFNIMYSKRDKDGVDWYDYLKAKGKFMDGSVKMTCYRDHEGDWVVGAANRDPTMLFPGSGQIILEITDYIGEDPQDHFGRKIYDPDANVFKDGKF